MYFKKIHKQRLLKLAEFLDTLPEEKFEFRYTVDEWDEEHSCATVACAIGWTPLIFPNLTRWRDGSVESILSESSYYSTIAQELFGIDYYYANILFLPTTFPEPEDERVENALYPLGDDATPKDVAAQIRKFLELKALNSI